MNDERDDRPDRDEAVSRAYRDAATERAPATLNEQVLRKAAEDAGRGYPRWAGWLKPLAWTATVGLTLAIVIELTDVTGPARDRAVEPLPETALPASQEPARAPARARRDAGSEVQEDAAPASEAFAVDGAPLLEEAADMAATRSGSEGREKSTPSRSAEELPADAPACDEEARRRPETWHRCIERLRAEGSERAAERESEALAAAFPDFEPAGPATR